MSKRELTATTNGSNTDHLLGGKLYPIEEPLRTQILSELGRFKSNGALQADANTLNQQTPRVYPSRGGRVAPKSQTLCASNAIEMARGLLSDSRVDELDQPNPEERASIGKREPLGPNLTPIVPDSQNISNQKKPFRPKSQFSELGKRLEPILAAHYSDRFLEPSNDASRCSTSVKCSLPAKFGEFANLVIDMVVATKHHRELKGLYTSCQAMSVPVEIKVMSSDLFASEELIRKEARKEPQAVVPSDVPADELAFLDGLVADTKQAEQFKAVQELLIQRKLLSKTGSLRLSHPWVFQSMCYALTRVNTRKVGQLAILTPKGLYVHTFEVSEHDENKIQSLLKDTKAKLPTNSEKPQATAAATRRPRFYQFYSSRWSRQPNYEFDDYDEEDSYSDSEVYEEFDDESEEVVYHNHHTNFGYQRYQKKRWQNRYEESEEEDDEESEEESEEEDDEESEDEYYQGYQRYNNYNGGSRGYQNYSNSRGYYRRSYGQGYNRWSHGNSGQYRSNYQWNRRRNYY